MRCRFHWAILLLIPVGVTGAEVYRWTDEQGQIHFSDKPVAEGAERLRVKPADTYSPVVPPALYPGRNYRQEALDSRAERREQRLRRERQQAQEEKRQRLCQKAREDLQRFNRQTYTSAGLSALQKRRERRDKLKSKIRDNCY